MTNGKTTIIQKQTIHEITREAAKTKRELESYLEDLELFGNPEFWEAVRDVEEGRVTRWKSLEEYRKRMVK